MKNRKVTWKMKTKLIKTPTRFDWHENQIFNWRWTKNFMSRGIFFWVGQTRGLGRNIFYGYSLLSLSRNVFQTTFIVFMAVTAKKTTFKMKLLYLSVLKLFYNGLAILWQSLCRKKMKFEVCSCLNFGSLQMRNVVGQHNCEKLLLRKLTEFFT
jgi:hypothetical protein